MGFLWFFYGFSMVKNHLAGSGRPGRAGRTRGARGAGGLVDVIAGGANLGKLSRPHCDRTLEHW